MLPIQEPNPRYVVISDAGHPRAFTNRDRTVSLVAAVAAAERIRSDHPEATTVVKTLRRLNKRPRT